MNELKKKKVDEKYGWVDEWMDGWVEKDELSKWMNNDKEKENKQVMNEQINRQMHQQISELTKKLKHLPIDDSQFRQPYSICPGHNIR